MQECGCALALSFRLHTQASTSLQYRVAAITQGAEQTERPCQALNTHVSSPGVSRGLHCRNFLDVGAYALQTVIVIMHLSRAGVDSNALSVIVAIQVLLLWIKVQYYARQAPRGTTQLLPLTFPCMHLPLPLSVAKLVSSILQAYSGRLSLASARVISLHGEGSTQVMQASTTPSMSCLPPKADRENVCNSVCKVQGAAAHKESLCGHPKGGAG